MITCANCQQGIATGKVIVGVCECENCGSYTVILRTRLHGILVAAISKWKVRKMYNKVKGVFFIGTRKQVSEQK